jgi:hypothetical protein
MSHWHWALRAFFFNVICKTKEICVILLMKTDYKEVSSEMQTICFPMLPPVIMDWKAAGKKKILGYMKR